MGLKSIFAKGKSGTCPGCNKHASTSVLLECDHCGNLVHVGGSGCGIAARGEGKGASCKACNKGRLKSYEELYEDAA